MLQIRIIVEISLVGYLHRSAVSQLRQENRLLGLLGVLLRAHQRSIDDLPFFNEAQFDRYEGRVLCASVDALQRRQTWISQFNVVLLGQELRDGHVPNLTVGLFERHRMKVSALAETSNVVHH